MPQPELRADQLAFGRAVFSELATKRSTLAIAHPGWGKTIAFMALAARVARAKGKPVLVVHHRGELGEQIESTALRFGLTVGKEEAHDTIDWANPPQLIVASIQSLSRRLARYAPGSVSFMICDEAHHAWAQSYRKIFDHFSDVRVLGVTATPDRGDGEALGEVFESIAFRVELADGIASGRHAPVSVIQATIEGLDTSSIKTKSGELDPAALEQELLRDGPMHAAARALSELHEGRQTIVFNPGCAYNQALAELLPEYGVSATWVDGSLTKVERAKRIAAYESGEVRMLCNVGILTEGYDNPKTSCVAMVRMPASRALFVQMMCRGGRPAPGKSDMLLVHFQAETLGKAKLTAAADALEGCLWKRRPDYGNHKKEAAEKAELEKAAAVAREIQQIGIHLAVVRYPLGEVIRAAEITYGAGQAASERQIAVLKKLGFQLKDRELTREEAQLCFDIIARREAAGLMTVKQAKKLCPHGFADDLPRNVADARMNELSRNGWKPPRAWDSLNA